MILLYSFLAINLIAFVLIGYDKQLAIKNKNRISEKTLLVWVALGGTIGSSLAMSVFRHKTAKTSYLLKFFGIIFVQILTIIALFHFDLISL
ncbi:DUF1294 domain-containing protein [Flavobacterium granuli]|uniref:Uncharacterized membrane protein YsdA (DUF1294 family) n=1 Tax=Flavobacterium granuli TaxID=280093 RepID=A0ABU1S1W1_9FLAO|nr:DUF1294 domain-containing protein [Flavobacterium granuli]MDR6845032.1 uncharacterized membrane protein YsdA (DUF1294 family) [Flavobacterium granuli]